MLPALLSSTISRYYICYKDNGDPSGGPAWIFFTVDRHTEVSSLLLVVGFSRHSPYSSIKSKESNRIILNTMI